MAAELADDRRLADAVAELAPAVFELSEFLVQKLGVEDVGAYYPHRVTYHPTCHSLRMLQVGDAPLRLLRAVRGIDLVELPDAEQCCGFGGTFAVKNADTSMAMLGDKLRRVLDTRAEVCAAADNSCLMHIGGGLNRQRAGVRTVHLAEILATHRGEDDSREHRSRQTPSPAADSAPSRSRARESLAESQLRRNMGKATQTIRAQARRRRRGAARLGGAARGRPRDQGAHAAPPRRLPAAAGRVRDARRRAGPLGARRRGGQPHHHPDRAAPRRREVVKVKSLTTDEIKLNARLERRGHRRRVETDLAELIIQLAGEHSSHILVPAIHKNRAEIRELFMRSSASTTSPTSRRTWRRSPGAPAREVPQRAGRRSAAPTSPWPRPAPSASSSPRATGACA